jgi:hypothetical protein
MRERDRRRVRRPGPAAWCLCCLLALIAGWAGAAPAVPESGSELDRWVARELAPWLRRQATEHPRLRGGPLTVAVVDGRHPDPKPDALSVGVKERLYRLLLDTRGVDLAPEPAPPDWQRPTPPRLDCRPSPARYMVAIAAAEDDGRGRVDVRVLDLTEDSWIGGFARGWEGRLTRGERSAAQRRTALESLRGARGLPFEARQGDILAGHLARGLGCGLLARPTDLPAVWIDESATAGPYGPAVGLVAQYLARSDLLRLAAEPGEADMTLSAQVHDVDGEIAQLWVSLRPRDGGVPAGIEAAAYVHSPRPEASMLARAAPAPASPAPADPTPRPSTVGLEAGATSTGAVLETLRILRLPRPCRPDDCDARGERLDPTLPLPAGQALALEAVTPVPSRVFVLEWDPDSGLRRLAPGACRAETGVSLTAGRRLRHALDAVEGDLTLFVVALPERRAEGRLAGWLARVPAGCGQRLLSGTRLSRWLESFDAAAREGDLAWRALRLAFEPATPGPMLADDRP